MKAIMFLIPFAALVGCAGTTVRQDTLPSVGTALNGLLGFYSAVCMDPLPEHLKACETVYPHLVTTTDWYTIVNEAAK